MFQRVWLLKSQRKGSWVLSMSTVPGPEGQLFGTQCWEAGWEMPGEQVLDWNIVSSGIDSMIQHNSSIFKPVRMENSEQLPCQRNCNHSWPGFTSSSVPRWSPLIPDAPVVQPVQLQGSKRSQWQLYWGRIAACLFGCWCPEDMGLSENGKTKNNGHFWRHDEKSSNLGCPI